jgi:uncharacterized protein YheU (UPF0270 family)
LDDEPHDPIVVPHTALAADLLRGIVEAFVLREGTDYGEREFSLEQKVAHVMRELDRGKVHIIFDPISQTVNLIAAGTAALPAH